MILCICQDYLEYRTQMTQNKKSKLTFEAWKQDTEINHYYVPTELPYIKVKYFYIATFCGSEQIKLKNSIK
jgi:hypothetical protein